MGGSSGGLVVLTRDMPSGRAVANALHDEFESVTVVAERPIAIAAMVRGRLRTYGMMTVLGQLLFLAIAVPLLDFIDHRRISEIVGQGGLRTQAFEVPVRHVSSVNDHAAIVEIVAQRPAAIVVVGTRILTAEVLAILGPIINIHAGITPAYRGGHGGYWALVDGRPDLVGTTIHLIDAGIDTGPVIDQVRFEIGRPDSFVTYPWLHLSAGIPALIRAVHAAVDGTLTPMPDPPRTRSILRTHPTLWGYIWARLAHGVR